MSKLDKNGQNGPFYELDRRRQKAVIMLFEDELTHEDLFKAAQRQYRSIVIKEDYESKALKKLNSLLNAKSEMVQLQSATTILKMAGMLSENDTPELTRAKVRKANAEADIAEQKAKLLKNDKTGITKIVFTDDMKSDKEDDTDQKRDESDGANT